MSLERAERIEETTYRPPNRKSSRSPNKKKRRKKNKNINSERLKRAREEERSTTLVLVFIALGLVLLVIGTMFNHLTQTQIPTTTAEIVTVSHSIIETGIIIRSETYYSSNITGEINFNIEEGERVSRGQNIANIGNIANEATQENLEENEEIIEVVSNDVPLYILEASENITEHIREIALLNVNSLTSDLEYTIQSYIQRRNAIFSPLSSVTNVTNTQNSLFSTSSGIFTRYVDNFSWLNPSSMYTLTNLQTSSFAMPVRILENAYSGDTAFRIINSNMWYIAAHISNENLVGVQLGTNIPVYISTTYDEFRRVNMNVHHLVESNYESFIILSTRDYVFDFLSSRSINFKLFNTQITGLQIPREALTTRSFIVIPKNFTITLEDAPRQRYVYIQTHEGILRFNIFSYRIREDYILVPQDINNHINLGQNIINSSGQIYVINDIITEEGVFRANIGIASFTALDMSEAVFNDNYIIVSLSNQGRFGLNIHDRIVSDAQNVLVYEGIPVF